MAKWEEAVKKDCDEIIKKNKLNKINKLSKLRLNSRLIIFILIIVLPIIPIAIITTLSYFWPNVKGQITIFILIACIIVLLIAMGLIKWKRSKILRIKNEIVDSLDFYHYYTVIFKELTNDKYQLTSLSNSFDVAVFNFLPEKGVNLTDEVLNFSCNNVNYSYGTITNETITIITTGKGGQIVKPIYTRYRYLNLTLEQSTNLNATIQPSKSFLSLSSQKIILY